jgi:hypothetical protein
MSAERKIAGDEQPMNRLKRLCAQNTAIRDELLKLLDEKKSAEWRAAVKERFGIWLSSDSQVTRWRDWVHREVSQERLNDFSEHMEQALQKFNPEASLTKIREFTIATIMAESLASGAHKMALAAVDRDQTERHGRAKVQLEKAKIELAERRVKLLEDKVRNAQAVIDSAKKTGGGLTKETLEKIEAELKLL